MLWQSVLWCVVRWVIQTRHHSVSNLSPKCFCIAYTNQSAVIRWNRKLKQEQHTEQSVYIFSPPGFKLLLHKLRSAANSTYARTHRGQTSGLEPAASCLPLGCWLRSTSELIANLVHAHIYTDKTKVHEHVNTHSQRQPAVFGACGAVFGFDHLFKSHLTGVGAALSLCVSPSFSPLCPLLFLGKRGGVTCITIYIYSQ